MFYEEIISKNWLIMNGVNWLIMNGGVGYYRALHSSLVQYKLNYNTNYKRFICIYIYATGELIEN